MGATGHLNTLLPLGQELKQRGHAVTVFSAPSVQAKVEVAGLTFHNAYSLSIEDCQHEDQLKTAKRSGNLQNLQQTLQRFAEIAEARLQTIPEVIREQDIDALIVDFSVLEGGTIANHLGIPYITVCCVLPFYQDPAIPPVFTTWQHNPALWAKLRNQIAYRVLNYLARPTWQVIASYRQHWQLPTHTKANDIFSELAIITRHIPEFEFPRQFPPHFHFTGPFHQSAKRETIPFPCDQLNDKPLIYASMGTLQNRSRSVFYAIAESCADLDAQLVISLGGGLEPTALPDLSGNPLVVKYAPQLELLQKATLNITHAGLNTVLESLSYGVPMVAIPITDDQPGIAARIVWTGTGELISFSRITVSKLKLAIEQVLTQALYKKNAVRLQNAIHQTNGVSYASNIIEQAVFTRQPVVSR
ncbi:mgt family [Leptolyngbya sp. Heron Island J]|nr:mgt family [Leptolyngbya sp. Heron Island J]